MGKIADHQSGQTTKILLLGDSGSGKTGALASLAEAGYNLRVTDVDNGVDALKNVLLDPRSPYKPGSADRVNFVTITEKMKNVGGKLIPRSATVWTRAIKLLENWEETRPNPDSTAEKPLPPIVTDSFGSILTWTPQDILVIDSLTFLCQAALNFVLSMNARLGGRVEQSDWYQAQQMVEGLLQMLYDEAVKCNVIISAHVGYSGDDNSPLKGQIISLGKALSPKIPRYFNNMLMMKTSGSGANVKRKLITMSTREVELKSSAPMRVKAEYDIERGLAEYFRDVKGEK